MSDWRSRATPVNQTSNNTDWRSRAIIIEEPKARKKDEIIPQTRWRTALEQGLQGATFNFADEMITPLAATAAIIMQEPSALWRGEIKDPAFREQIAQAPQYMKQANEQQMEKFPVTSIGANIGGALLTGGAGAGTKAGAALGRAIGSGSTGARILKGAGAGAASAGLYGAGAADEGERMQGAGEAAILGGAIGGGVPAASALVKGSFKGAKNIFKGLGARGEEALDETAQAIKNKSREAYQRMRDVGATFNQQGGEAILDTLDSTLKKDGPLNPKLHDKTIAVMDDIKSNIEGGEVGLEQLDQWRQVLGDIAGNFTDKINGRKATLLIDALDDAAEKVSGNSKYLASGTPEALDALNIARQEWSRQSKFNRIADLVKGASGDANKLKRDLEKFRLNPKKTRGFSKEELAALKEAATQTTGEGFMKMLGKFGFDFGSGRAAGNTALPLLGAGAGALGSGTVAGVAVPAIGTVSRAGQKALAAGKAENLLRVIEQNGGKVTPEIQKQIMLLPPKEAQSILNSSIFLSGNLGAMASQGVNK